MKDLLPLETMSFFFATLALVCLAAAAVVAAVALLDRDRSDRSAVGALRDDLGRIALPVAWLVALVTMLGSLYYSRVQSFVPCELCWYQRICAYPFAVILGIAAWRRDASIRVYAVPVMAIGVVISAYHSWIQAFPPTGGTSFCTVEAPCTERYVWEFGFVSLPFMALSAFVVMIALLLVARPGTSTASLQESP